MFAKLNSTLGKNGRRFTLSTLPTQFSGMLRQSTTLAQPRNVLGRQGLCGVP